ncbi:MAG: hypothetical protein ACREBC_27860 [Pyrinomonadaceae bacterium]
MKLTLPRSIDLSLKNIAGSVRLGAIDGMLRLNNIAGQVTVAPSAGSRDFNRWQKG